MKKNDGKKRKKVAKNDVLKEFIDCTTIDRNGKVTIDVQKHISAYQQAKELFENQTPRSHD